MCGRGILFCHKNNRKNTATAHGQYMEWRGIPDVNRRPTGQANK